MKNPFKQKQIVKHQLHHWQTQLTLAQQKPWLASLLLRRVSRLKAQIEQLYQQVGILNCLSGKQRRRWKKMLTALVSGGGLTMLINLPILAAGISVNHTADVIADDGFCTLREAMIAANTDTASGGNIGECEAGSGADVISLPAGTFTLSQAGSNEDLAMTGDLDVLTNTAVTLVGQGAGMTMIDGNGLDRVLHLQSGGALTLSNVTVQGGNAGSDKGGGLFNEEGQLVLQSSVISGNSAQSGGGIYNSAETGTATVTITDTKFISNTMTSYGGAIGNSSKEVTAQALVTLSDSTISGNKVSYYGGGIYNRAQDGLAQVTITRTDLIANTADGEGGGIYNFVGNVNGQASIIVASGTISGNTAHRGGGIANKASLGTARLTISDSTLSGNTTSNDGAAIISYTYNNLAQSLVTVENSTISNNRARRGAGLANRTNSGLAAATITNTQFISNSVTEYGGSIDNLARNVNGQALITLSNSTISDNRGNQGGGIANRAERGTASVAITNTQFTTNRADQVGGALYNFAKNANSQAQLTLSDSTISENAAVLYGAGLYNQANRGIATVTIVGTQVVSNAGQAQGGGLVSITKNSTSQSSITIADSIVSNNTANERGGGIFHRVFEGTSHLVISETQLISNTADCCGAIYNDTYGTSGQSFVTITDSTISGNTVMNGGGAVYNYISNGVGQFTLANTQITLNQAGKQGGAIANYVGYADSQLLLTITNSTISENQAAKQGGGIYNRSSYGTISMTMMADTQIMTNTAGSSGGGIYSLVEEGSGRIHGTLLNSTISGNTAQNGAGISHHAIYGTIDLTISNSTLASNHSAKEGGGLFNYARNSGGQTWTTLANSTLSGNIAQTSGGGSYQKARDIGSQSHLTLINSTVVSNTADYDSNGSGTGGGLTTSGAGTTTVTMSNTIIANNFSQPNSMGSTSDISGTVTGNAHNLISNLAGASGSVGTGTDIVEATVLIGPLADNGGNTLTHALLENSPAIDAADDTICQASPINSLDQRGEARSDGMCDIGAFESSVSMTTIHLPMILKNQGVE
ncbi:MAG: choice-of-anchor Q domain-containing protein [Chloroflexota bacterium]